MLTYSLVYLLHIPFSSRRVFCSSLHFRIFSGSSFTGGADATVSKDKFFFVKLLCFYQIFMSIYLT